MALGAMNCYVDIDCTASDHIVFAMMGLSNSHAGTWNAKNPYKICCKIACASVTQSCADDPCCTGFYCSNITPSGSTTPPHCCLPGYYWDPFFQECRETEACYDPTLPEDFCAYLPPNNPKEYGGPEFSWWGQTKCLQDASMPPSQACCYVAKYGLNPTYDYKDQLGRSFIQVYGRTSDT